MNWQRLAAHAAFFHRTREQRYIQPETAGTCKICEVEDDVTFHFVSDNEKNIGLEFIDVRSEAP